MLSGNFYGSEIWHGIFGGVKFWSRDFLGFCLKPKGFFWVLIFAPIQTSLSLEIWSTPPCPCAKLLFCLLPGIVCLIVFHVLIAVALSDFKVPKNNS